MPEPLSYLGFLLIMLGSVSVLIGLLLTISGAATKRGRVAGAVLVGPFPLVFGDRELVKYAFALLLIFVFLALLMLVWPGLVSL